MTRRTRKAVGDENDDDDHDMDEKDIKLLSGMEDITNRNTNANTKISRSSKNKNCAVDTVSTTTTTTTTTQPASPKVATLKGVEADDRRPYVSSSSSSSSSWSSSSAASATAALASTLPPHLELSLRLDKLVAQLTASYAKYAQLDEQLEFERAALSDGMAQDQSDQTELKRARATAFEHFMLTFDELSTTLAACKRDAFAAFVAAFQTTSGLTVIRLYEFLSKLLLDTVAQTTLSATRCASAPLPPAAFSAHSKSQAVMTRRALEFLHVLTVNQSREQDDDESTIICSEQLACSYNFTTPLCAILLSAISAGGGGGGGGASVTHVPGDLTVRLAFSVLNKLSGDHALFAFDIYAKQLALLLVEKIVSRDFQACHVQFLANLLRHNGAEARDLLRSTAACRALCRQLVLSIKENPSAALIMNALVVLLKLGLGDSTIFGALWPAASSQQRHTAQGGGGGGGGGAGAGGKETLLTRLFEPLDMALNVLTTGPSSSSVGGALATIKLSALNFLDELVKCDTVRATLESNVDYANVFLFRLNQLLVENELRSRGASGGLRLPSTFASKILRIFIELATRSSQLARTLFRIAFDTQAFVENSRSSSSSGRQSDELTRKLKNLMVSSASSLSNAAGADGRSRKSMLCAESETEGNGFNAIIDFYFKSSRLLDAHSETPADNAEAGENATECDQEEKKQQQQQRTLYGSTTSAMCSYPMLTRTLLQYLFTLFKNMEANSDMLSADGSNEWSNDGSTTVATRVSSLCRILVDNFRHLYSRASSAFATASTTTTTKTTTNTSVCNFLHVSSGGSVGRNEETLVADIYFYNTSLLDCVLRNQPSDSVKLDSDQSRRLGRQVHALLKNNCWLPSSSAELSGDLVVNGANTLATAKLLLGLIVSEEVASGGSTGADELRQSAFAYWRDKSFLHLLAAASDQWCTTRATELSQLAFELLIELNEIARHRPHLKYRFPHQTYLQLCATIKQSRSNAASTTPALPLYSVGFAAPSGQQPATLPATVPPFMAAGPRAPPAAPLSSSSHGSLSAPLDPLFDFYDHKLNAQKAQEAQLMNTLNQYFSASLLREVEFRTLRDRIRQGSAEEARLGAELARAHTARAADEARALEQAAEHASLARQHAELGARAADLERRCAELGRLERRHAELVSDHAELGADNRKLSEQCERLRQDMEQAEKSNEESIENLQRTISNEINAKKDLQLKLKDVSQKWQTGETRRKELDARIVELTGELERKTADYDQLSAENEKLKSIFSYVKDNFK